MLRLIFACCAYLPVGSKRRDLLRSSSCIIQLLMWELVYKQLTTDLSDSRMGCVSSKQKPDKFEKPEQRPESHEPSKYLPAAGQQGRQEEFQVHEIHLMSVNQGSVKQDKVPESKQNLSNSIGPQSAGLVGGATKKNLIQKYNINVKDTNNRILNVNSYNYEALLQHNPNVLQIK